MLACTWTLASSIYQLHVGSPAVAVPIKGSLKTDGPTFADRFAPAAPLAAATAMSQKAKNVYVALFDATYSLGGAPESFRKPVPIVVASADASAKIEMPPAIAAPVVRQAALSAPIPAARPTEQIKAPAELKLKSPGAFSHDALVQQARAALMASASSSKLNVFEKLFKSTAPSTVLAFAGSDGGVLPSGEDAKPEFSATDRTTAVYDISAKMVYMPDGSKLEAHSGLGSRMDDPDYAHERMRGVTPPHIYDLKPREALFHGVAALRLTPVGGEGAIHGRSGLLAHTYMLGPNGQSNGCVSFKDYNKFLQAYRNGDVKRLIVVAKL
jgi:hypothetical protein